MIFSETYTCIFHMLDGRFKTSLYLSVNKISNSNWIKAFIVFKPTERQYSLIGYNHTTFRIIKL